MRQVITCEAAEDIRILARDFKAVCADVLVLAGT